MNIWGNVMNDEKEISYLEEMEITEDENVYFDPRSKKLEYILR